MGATTTRRVPDDWWKRLPFWRGSEPAPTGVEMDWKPEVVVLCCKHGKLVSHWNAGKSTVTTAPIIQQGLIYTFVESREEAEWGFLGSPLELQPSKGPAFLYLFRTDGCPKHDGERTLL